MTELHPDQRLIDAAIDFIERRFPGKPSAGAAAMYAEDGDILISTALEVANDSVALCHEVGAICEAYAKDKNILATVCVLRAEDGRFVILAACGVCQERLWYWGGNVEVAVPLDDDSTKWKAVTLGEMAPHYWRKKFMKGHLANFKLDTTENRCPPVPAALRSSRGKSHTHRRRRLRAH